ncbi:hypothetical protein [Ammoniphilus oxalaticus]|nr:hypothetical protein [Ammoniphilus oxalaticus]
MNGLNLGEKYFPLINGDTLHNIDTFYPNNHVNHKYKSGLELLVDKELYIKRIWLQGPSIGYITSKGVSIGNNRSKVIDLYGKNFYMRHEQGADIIGYIDRKRNSKIEFWTSENIVHSIRYDKRNLY